MGDRFRVVMVALLGLSMATGCTRSVIVRDPTGQPIADAQVAAVYYRGVFLGHEDHSTVKMTDRQGIVRFNGPPSELWVRKPGYVTTTIENPKNWPYQVELSATTDPTAFVRMDSSGNRFDSHGDLLEPGSAPSRHSAAQPDARSGDT